MDRLLVVGLDEPEYPVFEEIREAYLELVARWVRGG